MPPPTTRHPHPGRVSSGTTFCYRGVPDRLMTSSSNHKPRLPLDFHSHTLHMRRPLSTSLHPLPRCSPHLHRVPPHLGTLLREAVLLGPCRVSLETSQVHSSKDGTPSAPPQAMTCLDLLLHPQTQRPPLMPPGTSYPSQVTLPFSCIFAAQGLGSYCGLLD